MAINNVNITIDPFGLNTSISDNEDFISGFSIYASSLPSGFSSSGNVIEMFSINDAEGAGISSSSFGLAHYQISRFFTQAPSAPLYVQMNVTPSGAHTFQEVANLQYFAQGKIKQVGVITPKTLSTLHATTLQNIASTLKSQDKDLQIIYTGDGSTLSLSSLTDLRLLTNPNVSICIAEDGANIGKSLRTSTGKSVSAIGDMLGMIARSSVSDSIGNPANFNAVRDAELDTIAFITGDLYRNLNPTLINQLSDYHYNFLIKRKMDGSFWNDSKTAVADTNDLSTIENNRVIQKAKRNIIQILEPEIADKLRTNDDGTIQAGLSTYFEGLIARALDGMKANDEISGYSVFINPKQKPATTSSIAIVVKLLPIAIGRNINITLSFSVSV